MAQVNLIVGNITSTVRNKVARRKRNSCERFCDEIPFLVCPCTLVGLLELLSGNIQTYVLSTFTILGVLGLFYSSLFGWNSTIMDFMIAIAFVGPLWVTFTIAPKANLSGVKAGMMGEIEALQHTNRSLRKKLEKYRKNLGNLRRATTKVAKRSKVRHWTVKKSRLIRKRLRKEDEKIAEHVVKFRKSMKNIQSKVKSLPKMITDFERRVEDWLTMQMRLEFTNEDFACSQQHTERFIQELKYIPRSLKASVGEMEYIEECYVDAGSFAKEVAPVVDKIQEEWTRLADLVRSQELSFCRMLAWNISERSDLNRFGKEEYILFVDRLPTYMAIVLTSDDLKFRKYTTNRRGVGRYIAPAGLKRLIEDIVDGVEKIDQTSTVYMIPDKDALAKLSREDTAQTERQNSMMMWRTWTMRSSKNA